MTNTATTRVAVLGATGYVGGQLLALLAGHNHVQVTVATSVRHAGKLACELHPSLGPAGALQLTTLDTKTVAEQADLVLSALPHGASAKVLGELAQAGLPIVDLSADYRFTDPAAYAQAYGTDHPCPELARTAVYGLPEFNRKQIAGAKLVGVPGCYPTATLLALLPLLTGGFVKQSAGVIVDAKSGISGAGREASEAKLFAEVAEGVRAYNVGCHRHQPEMTFHANAIGGMEVDIFFTPQVVPMSRGILASVYVRIADGVDASLDKVAAHYKKTYADSPFGTVLEDGYFPNTRNVTHTNRFEVGLAGGPQAERLVALCAIDNLVKGAAGQAIQCMNLMLGHPEATGLPTVGYVA